MERKSRGRQKISMKKMKNESNLQVTFSKRRAGLFKKASELCTLCGVDLTIIVFSPGQKVYSFGHPSIDAMVNKYINDVTNTNPLLINPMVEAPHNANTIKRLNEELTHFQNHLDIEVARAQYLKHMNNDNLHAPRWWNVDNINELNFQQLEYLKDMMENLRNGVTKEQEKISLEAQRVNMAYQENSINPFDGQPNSFFSSFPNVTTTNGARSDVPNPAPYPQ